MVKKRSCSILLFLFSFVSAAHDTFPRRCVLTGSFDRLPHHGSCVHPKQCPGYYNQTTDCRSPTGRKLVCCENFFPRNKHINKNDVCGVRPLAELMPRETRDTHQIENMETEAIVGGVEAWKFSWPWMAALYEKRNFMCGGALISPNCVVTAAHCFDGMKDPKHYFVRLGEHSLYVDAKDEYPEEIQASEIKVHPLFESNCSDNDIAVIRLSTPSQLTPVCLPTNAKHQKFVGYNAVVSGWGTTKYDSQYREPFSPYLQEITIPVQTTAFCEEHYKTIAEYSKAFKKGLEESRFICGGVEDGTRDACLGDSGGPLVVELSPNKWTLIGVVCIGYGCGMKGYPGVYTRVTEYLPWVKQFCEN